MHERLRHQYFPRRPIDGIGKAIAVKVYQDFPRSPVGSKIDQHALVDPVIIPGVVRSHLIRPLGFAGIGVAGEERHRPLIVTWALIRIPRSRIAGAVVEEIEFGVVAIPTPSGPATFLPLLSLPG